MDDSIEALWSLEFKTSDNYEGAGIVVFDTGRILGGDSAFIFVGNYEVSQGVVKGEVNVSRYSDKSGLVSAFPGLNDFNLVISGDFDPRKMTLHGQVKEDASRHVTLTCVRRAEFPFGTP